MRIAQRVNRIKPSATVSITARAARMAQEGRDVIALSVGEPDFATPQHICDAAIEAIARGETKYTVVGGSTPLKQAIAERIKRDSGAEVGSDEILVSSGAKQSCFNACEALIEAGDEVIIPAPCWVSYPDMVRFAGGDPVIVHTEAATGFKATPTQISAAITDATRAVIFNSPCNPTGASYTKREWQEIAAVLIEHPRVVIVCDEIYDKLFWGESPYSGFMQAAPELRSRTITVNGVSKTYAMTGWRVGYAIGTPEVIAAMETIQSQSTTSACSISQAAATAALNGDQRCVEAMCAEFADRQRYVIERLNAIDGTTCHNGDGTFYAFADIREALATSQIKNDVAFCEALLEEAGVALVPGSAFLAPGFLRLSFAASRKKLSLALDRLEHFVAEKTR